MKRRLFLAAAASVLLFPLSGGGAFPQSRRAVREEASEHPRIARAIHELEDAIDYMQKAPHDFGGHKAEAIAASREAIVQLKKALAYRARQEGK